MSSSRDHAHTAGAGLDYEPPPRCPYCHGTGWTFARYDRGPEPCGCDDADFFEILAEQEVYSDE